MKKKNLVVIGIIFFIVVLVSSISAYKIYAQVKGFDNYIYPGVKIGSEDMSGKTVSEAKKILNEKYQTPLGSKKINITAGNKKYSLTYSQLDAKYNIEKAVNTAYQYGHNENIINKYKLLKNPQEHQIKLSFSYNSKSGAIDDIINNIKKDVDKPAKNATITKSGSDFAVTSDVDGYKLDESGLKNSIVSAVNDNLGTDDNVQAKINTVKANATKEKLQSINTLIATFSTSYGAGSSPQRATNIQLATKAISGLCLMPGDTFSFNKVVGERTAQKGYQSAPVDIGNTTGMGLGGGVCQVSTTLYNSILLSGIKPTVREHHSIPSAYVPLGLDATVSYGGPDYQFKNTLSYPIYIEGSSANGTETFNIYSNSSLTSKTYKVLNDISSSGKDVKVYLQTYQNGAMIKNDLISHDTY